MLDKEPGLGDGAEPVLVEAVIAEGAVEALHESVLHGLAGLDVVKVDLVLHRPEMKGFSGELGPIVDGDGGRQAAR